MGTIKELYDGKMCIRTYVRACMCACIVLHKIYLRQHGFQMKGIVQAEQCVMYVRTYVIWLMHLTT